MAHTVDRLFHTFKDIFDALESVPGIAAFIKVFFGSEEGQQKMKDRLLKDIRDELFEDLRLLGKDHRENLIRRLHEAKLRGEEDKLVWNLCKIKREARRDALDWLNRLDDHEFEVMADLLDDDKFRQFARRMILFFREEVGPVMKAAANATGSTAKSATTATVSAVKDGAMKADRWAADTAAPAVRRFRSNQKWLKPSRKRRRRWENQAREQEEQLRQQRE